VVLVIDEMTFCGWVADKIDDAILFMQTQQPPYTNASNPAGLFTAGSPGHADKKRLTAENFTVILIIMVIISKYLVLQQVFPCHAR
jgi:hypothetical protein